MSLIDPIASDLLSRASVSALGGITAQQEALAHNLANATTPGFIASRVDFEDSLAAAISTGSPESATIASTATADPMNADGNNVQVAQDTMALRDSQLSLDSAVAAFNFRMSILADGLSR